jgi:hypothetical protein
MSWHVETNVDEMAVPAHGRSVADARRSLRARERDGNSERSRHERRDEAVAVDLAPVDVAVGVVVVHVEIRRRRIKDNKAAVLRDPGIAAGAVGLVGGIGAVGAADPRHELERGRPRNLVDDEAHVRDVDVGGGVEILGGKIVGRGGEGHQPAVSEMEGWVLTPKAVLLPTRVTRKVRRRRLSLM